MKRQPAGVALADEIETAVRKGTHQPGAVLGLENELIERHGVGRSVVRQAVRILEQRGVAYTRRGNGGGLVVAVPEPSSAVRALSIVIGSQFADFTDISGLISASDSHQFLNCAARVDIGTCERLQRLAEAVEAMSVEEFQRSEGHFQVLNAFSAAFGDPAASLAELTGIDCGTDLVPYAMQVAESRRRGEFWELTRRLVDALVAGNVPLLFELRQQQWRMFAAKWTALGNLDRVEERITPKLNEAGSAVAPSEHSSADRLSREMLRDIRQLGWKIGERLGGTDELTARYGASPSVLRQAVCILEEYSAVEMQRGRGGGLVIAAPDEEVAVQRAVSYLRWAGAKTDDLNRFAIQLILEALNRSPHTTDRKRLPELRAIIDRIRSADAKRGRHGKEDLYLAIVRLSNSPALQLFVRVLIACLPEKGGHKHISAHAQAPVLLDEMFNAIITNNIPKARRAFLQYANLN